MKGLKNTSIFSKYDMLFSVIDLTKTEKTETKDKRKKKEILTLSSIVLNDIDIIKKVYFDEAFKYKINKNKEFTGEMDEAIEVLRSIINKELYN